MGLLKCKHCNKLFENGFGKGSLKRHQAAVKATSKRKSIQKSSNKLKPTKKTQSQIATGAKKKNTDSEENFVKKLSRNGFFAFRTGNSLGVPDIVAYKNNKLSFYEIKPAHGKSTNKTLLMKHQYDWMKKFCLNKKIEANVVFYKGSQPFKYSVVQITKKNIDNFVYNDKNAMDIFDRTDKLIYN